jgi:hypothetical protein
MKSICTNESQKEKESLLVSQCARLSLNSENKSSDKK